jgi:hypothetical protein
MKQNGKRRFHTHDNNRRPKGKNNLVRKGTNEKKRIN